MAYALSKRAFDVTFSAVVLIPCFLLVAACLLVLNPILNPGPMFYRPHAWAATADPSACASSAPWHRRRLRRRAAPTTRWKRSA
jgi:lipopolysaccharide/colanic/teichoic acid biosynthesis glycosyltransferase